jgi:hypothetical protein
MTVPRNCSDDFRFVRRSGKWPSCANPQHFQAIRGAGIPPRADCDHESLVRTHGPLSVSGRGSTDCISWHRWHSKKVSCPGARQSHSRKRRGLPGFGPASGRPLQTAVRACSPTIHQAHLFERGPLFCVPAGTVTPRGCALVPRPTSASLDRKHCSPSANPFHRRTRLQCRILAALPENRCPTTTHANPALQKNR